VSGDGPPSGSQVKAVDPPMSTKLKPREQCRGRL